MRLPDFARWRELFRLLRSYEAGRRRSRQDGPTKVQIQTVDGCNGACPACPERMIKGRRTHRMSDDLYARILSQLAPTRSLRSLCLMLQNEPLLDPILPSRVRLARRQLGSRVRLELVTNGSLLTPKRSEELIAAGVDQIVVSIDAISPETFAAVRPGLDFGKVVANTRALLDRAPNCAEVRFLRQRANLTEEAEFVRYWKELGVAVSVWGVNNRAGTLSGFDNLRVEPERPIRSWIPSGVRRRLPCPFGPFREMSILWDGRVLLCCQDWARAFTVGDLSRQSLADIWHGDAAAHCRHVLWRSRFDELPPCSACSFSGKRTFRNKQRPNSHFGREST